VAVQRSATLGSQDGRRACNDRHRADREWAAARQKPRGAPVRGRLTARDEGGDRALPLRRFPEKPFCDGTHRTNGFSSAAPGDGADDRRVDYVGRVITIHDNRALCAHAGVCTSALPAVWSSKRTPWIDPDGAGVEAIVETVRGCPSGALSYSVAGVEQPRSEPGAGDPRVRERPGLRGRRNRARRGLVRERRLMRALHALPVRPLEAEAVLRRDALGRRLYRLGTRRSPITA
jgi:uncharacterized Fe-S cluster protein YjdI